MYSFDFLVFYVIFKKKLLMISRKQFIDSLDKKIPNFRINQINDLLFDKTKDSFEQASNLPKDLVQGLNENCGFYSIKNVKIFKSKLDGTFKGLFKAKLTTS